MIDNTQTPTRADVREIEQKLILAMAHEAERRGIFTEVQAQAWLKNANAHTEGAKQ